MTTADFQRQFPKPWRFVMYGTSFSLRAANGAVIGQLYLQGHHNGIPQKEWNRHVASALSEHLPVVEESAATEARRAISERRSVMQWPAKEPPPAERTV